jgi:hypothetical protein
MSFQGSVALTTRHPSICKKLALTSPTSGGSSAGIVRSRTQATEFRVVGKSIDLVFNACPFLDMNSFV